MLNWWAHRDWLQLAEDGLCTNTKCTIRATDKCPVFRVIHWGKNEDLNNTSWKVSIEQEKEEFITELIEWVREWFNVLDVPTPKWIDISVSDTLRILNSVK